MAGPVLLRLEGILFDGATLMILCLLFGSIATEPTRPVIPNTSDGSLVEDGT